MNKTTEQSLHTIEFNSIKKMMKLAGNQTFVSNNNEIRMTCNLSTKDGTIQKLVLTCESYLSGTTVRFDNIKLTVE